jgi:hypothetical protein
MKVLSFLYDLGIVPNKNTGLENDPNLLQGQQYMEYGRVYSALSVPHLKLLETSSSNDINSIVETFYSDESTKSKYKTNDISNSSIENEFNRTVSKYSTAHKTFITNVVNNTYTKDEMKIYFTNLERLNDKLISLAKALGSEFDHVAIQNSDLSIKRNEQQRKLKTYIAELQKDKKHMTNITQDYNTLVGRKKESDISLTSNLYEYLVWILLATVIIGILINVMVSVSNLTIEVIIFVISLVTLFLIVKNLHTIYLHTIYK